MANANVEVAQRMVSAIAEEWWEQGFARGFTQGFEQGFGVGFRKGQLLQARRSLRIQLMRSFGQFPEAIDA